MLCSYVSWLVKKPYASSIFTKWIVNRLKSLNITFCVPVSHVCANVSKRVGTIGPKPKNTYLHAQADQEST